MSVKTACDGSPYRSLMADGEKTRGWTSVLDWGYDDDDDHDDDDDDVDDDDDDDGGGGGDVRPSLAKMTITAAHCCCLEALCVHR